MKKFRMASDAVESVIDWIPCEPGKKKRLYMAQGDDNTFTLMRTGAEGFDGLGRSPLFDAIYMCFADFRRLTPDEKRVYIAKERLRIAESLSPSIAVRILLSCPWGYSRLELGIRDAYYRLYHRFDNDPEHGSIPEKEQDGSDFLDQILDELLTNTSPALGRVWLQILSPSYFEKDVVETLRVARLNESESNDKSPASLQMEFSRLVKETIRRRFEKWIQKGKFSLGSDQQVRLDQVIQNFTELFFQSACEWVAFYYKNLLAGHLEEDNPIDHDPIEFLTFFCVFLPFDCILVDASSQRPIFDSMALRVDQEDGQHMEPSIDHNVVTLLVFPPPAPSTTRYVFESLGIVSPSNDPDGPSKLSRILPPDHPFVVHLRNSVSTQVEPSDKE